MSCHDSFLFLSSFPVLIVIICNWIDIVILVNSHSDCYSVLTGTMRLGVSRMGDCKAGIVWEMSGFRRHEESAPVLACGVRIASGDGSAGIADTLYG